MPVNHLNADRLERRPLVPIPKLRVVLLTPPTNAGWMAGKCEDGNKKVQNSGVISVSGQKTLEKCLEGCRDKPGVTGCEFHPPRKSCSAHTKEVVKGSGIKDYFCLVFPKQGLFISQLKFLLYLDILLKR